MSTCKVILNEQTLMDVTDTTAEAAEVLAGEYFYAADGTRTLGTGSGGGGVDGVFGVEFYQGTGTSSTTARAIVESDGTEIVKLVSISGFSKKGDATRVNLPRIDGSTLYIGVESTATVYLTATYSINGGAEVDAYSSIVTKDGIKLIPVPITGTTASVVVRYTQTR